MNLIISRNDSNNNISVPCLSLTESIVYSVYCLWFFYDIIRFVPLNFFL
jgi:hypothetical protein